MANHFSDPHLCPVCWQNWVHHQGIYCGSDCRRIASNFLNRIDYYRKVLSELGFCVTVHDGIFFHLEIPDDIKTFYPVYNHQFVWPTPGLSIDALDKHSLMDTVSAYIGPKAAALIDGYTTKDFNADVNFKFKFAYDVTKIWENPNNTTTCQNCGLPHVLTVEGWDANTEFCTDCSIAAIPF